MKKIILNIMVIAIAIVSFTSCSNKAAKQAAYIPKEANMVLIIDQNSMREKLKAGNFNVDSTFKDLIAKIDSSKATKLLKDWENSGVNTQERMFMFMTQGGILKSSQNMSINALVSISDAAKFEAFLKTQDGLKSYEIKKGEKFSTLKLTDESLISWNKDVAIFTAVHSNAAMYYDTASHSMKSNGDALDAATTLKFVDNLYSLKAENNLTNVKAFSTMLETKADAYMFSSTASVNSSLSMLPFSIPKLEELIKDNYGAYFLNFENGKIVVSGTSYFNDRVNNILKQYGSSNIDMKGLENFPASNVNAAMLVSFKPEIIGGFLKELQLDGLAEAALGKQGFSMQDVYKCTKGNFSLALGDFSMGNYAINADKNGAANVDVNIKPSMKFIVSSEVGDKQSLAKILDKAVELKMMVNTNGVYTLAPEIATTAPCYVKIDDKNITVANDEATYNAYIAKSAKANFSKDFTGAISGKCMAIYVNVNSLLNAFVGRASNDVHVKVVMDKALATFGDVVGTTSNFSDGKMHGEIVMKTKNENENSLVTIANFLKTVVVQIQEMDKGESKNSESNTANQQQIDSLLKAAEKL